ncbi:hypothetical protein FOPG_18832 [Fusarium oxysporum f. sp. conglutinans race 2 54008]|uniref:Heterokaryon incompatibility domain-containing protein n=3 Tax=Fusarium oxysporum f. sp. conglutinans TaxID=100902 RepID=A0A8H6GHI8_FUSOX|nr:hypothetical protein FOXB_17141 [Fusarium oxysporum f. sp. conglutinans Fo5176]EXL64923.1 hypothetical protein FOPG_18832 [Fusarium oxysporum f. sp. conglutinans race 2 54008]KAF6518214.1 hypothetical protein HZS61_002292 [Fusarium oxysporum f. sp. conglutinans]KAG6999841.1 Heterokaryon incompatibility protein 6, OR allele [Fusarium oxysporum f. sp. conglutinans]KAI8406184.1 hypothetical protein FOFC_13653 [Fusarium oxysporum]
MDESRPSSQNERQYAHEDVSNRDDPSNEYDRDLSDVSTEAPALEERLDGGGGSVTGAGLSPSTPGLGKVHRERAMDFALMINGPTSQETFATLLRVRENTLRTLQPRTLLNGPPPFSSGLYHRLPTENSIRLLEILRGARGTPIASRIYVTQLDDPHPYEALSYVWGEEEPYRKISVNDNDVRATPNLFHALERVRLEGRSRFIWVDQLCINQSDDDEKGQQVQLMSRIYKTANRVLVWLGKHDTSTPNAAFSLICEVVNYFSKSAQASFTSSGNITTAPVPNALPEVDSPRWLFLQHLFDLNWFWRVWVIQEIALSATASLMWGDSEIEWEYVGRAAAYIRIRKSNLFQHCFIPGIFNAYFMYRISIAANAVFKRVSLSFLRLLTMTQQYEASDPRDRVYGLLGVHSADSGRDGKLFIDPNYNLDIQCVYRAVALRIIEAEENLSLLSSVQHGPVFSFSQESWVPRWNTTVFTKSLLSGDIAHRHKADGDVPMVRFVSNDRSLTVGGLDAGKVTTVLEAMKTTDFQMIECASAYNCVWQCNSRVLPALQASEDHALLAYTLTAGKNWYGLLVENEETHVADFASWVVSRFNLSTSRTSLEPGSETATCVATSTKDRAHKDSVNTRFSAQTLQSQPPMLATDNDHQDFELFPRSAQKDVDYTETGDREHYKEVIGEQGYVLHQAYSSLADGGDAWRFEEAAQNACNGRRLFLTEDSRLGLGPAAMREGDHLCILFGASVPFILRLEGQSWRLIGECYVRTFMGGEGVEKYKEGREDSMRFEIC